MFQNEYRQKNKNSSFYVDFGFTDGYKSSLEKKKIVLIIYLQKF